MPSTKRLRNQSEKDVFSPNLFLQCHSDDEKQEDFSTQIWNCAFEPEQGDIVATCGGKSVCFINYKTNQVQSTFIEINETFYCLAWSSIQIMDKSNSILATGGVRGCIYLLHPKQAVLYETIKAYEHPVQTLLFSDTYKSHLLSADNNGNIILIDIGKPPGLDSNVSWTKLLSFTGTKSSIIKLALPLPDVGSYLLASSESGLFCWNAKGLMKPKSKQVFQKVEKPFTIYFPLKKKKSVIVDALILVNKKADIIASKCPGEGLIHIWCFSQLVKNLDNSKNNKNLYPIILCQLEWSSTSQWYLNIFSISNMLYAGDDDGSIWVYELDENCYKNTKNQPSYIIPFPKLQRKDETKISNKIGKLIINDIACCSDLKCLVITTDVNLVGLYKKQLSF